jgi:hypothetical protein
MGGKLRPGSPPTDPLIKRASLADAALFQAMALVALLVLIQYGVNFDVPLILGDWWNRFIG